MARKRKPRGATNARTGGLPTYPQPAPSQSIKAPSGRPHGERKKLEDAQRAVPVLDAQAQQAQQMRMAQVMQQATAFNPDLVPLGAPTQRPDEPVTSGLPMGRGPGPEALDIAPGGDDVGVILRAMYRDFPNEDLRALISELELEGR